MAQSRPVGVSGMVPDIEAFEQSALFGGEILSREEAIERCMTPLPVSQQVRSVRWSQERVYSLGASGDTIVFRPSVPFMNHQLREEYNPSHYTRIGREIYDFGQLQDCGVALFTGRAALEAYLSDSNDFYETDVSVEDIPEHRFGRLVTVYGHNRQLGSAAVNLAMHGHPDRGIALRGRLYRDPSFRQFLRMQAVENTGQSPPAWNRARSIARYYELSIRDGEPASFRQIAEYYGVNEDQIWRALNYVQLPDGVKQLVESDKLPYSGAIELKRLMGIYAEQDIIALAEQFASAGIRGDKIDQEVSKRIIVKGLSPEIQALVESEQVSSKQAELINELHRYGVSESEIRETVIWIITGQPRLIEVRELVAKMVKKVRDGQLSVFDQNLDPEFVDAEKSRIESASKRMQIGGAVKDIADRLSALTHILETGVAGGAVATKPIAERLQSLDGYVDKSLTRIAGLTVTDLERVNEIKSQIDGLNGHISPKMRKELDGIIASFENLLELEASTSPEDQEARITRIRERIARVQPVSATQSLF